MMSIRLLRGRLSHVHDPSDIRGHNMTKCGMLLRQGWAKVPAWYGDESAPQPPPDCPRCERRLAFEEYVEAVGGTLTHDGGGVLYVP